MQQKFNHNPEVLLPGDDNKPKGRSLWKNILSSSVFLQEHVRLQVHNGKSIRFWEDNWTSTGLLKDRYPAIYKVCSNKVASITDMIVNGRLMCPIRRNLNSLEKLDWNRLCNELGPVHGLNDEEDKIQFYEDGFTVKKSYELQVQEDVVCDFNRFLWKKAYST